MKRLGFALVASACAIAATPAAARQAPGAPGHKGIWTPADKHGVVTSATGEEPGVADAAAADADRDVLAGPRHARGPRPALRRQGRQDACARTPRSPAASSPSRAARSAYRQISDGHALDADQDRRHRPGSRRRRRPHRSSTGAKGAASSTRSSTPRSPTRPTTTACSTAHRAATGAARSQLAHTAARRRPRPRLQAAPAATRSGACAARGRRRRWTTRAARATSSWPTRLSRNGTSRSASAARGDGRSRAADAGARLRRRRAALRRRLARLPRRPARRAGQRPARPRRPLRPQPDGHARERGQGAPRRRRRVPEHAVGLGPADDRRPVRALPPRVGARPLPGRRPRRSPPATAPPPTARSPTCSTSSRSSDGSFPQNSEVDGKPHWTSLQLDEVALPIVLAWQLGRTDAATYAKLKRAADFIVRKGPETEQERWENQEGWSPGDDRGGDRRARVRRRHRAPQRRHRVRRPLGGDGRRLPAERRELDGDAATARTRADRTTCASPRTASRTRGKRYAIGDGGPKAIDQRRVVDPSFLELVRLGVKPLGRPGRRRRPCRSSTTSSPCDTPQRDVLAPLQLRRLRRDAHRRARGG